MLKKWLEKLMLTLGSIFHSDSSQFSSLHGLVRSSPLFPRVASTLRQKMASFQSLMDVVESDGCDPTPAQSSDTGGCISPRDYLSDRSSCSEGKENNPPATPTASRKRRLGPLEGCSLEIREGNICSHHPSSQEQKDATGQQQSPSRPPSDDPSAVSPAQQAHLLNITSLPSLLEMKPAVDINKTPVGQKKRKQVRFGGPLSPEFFDKNLPPSTPLQKGGTPARAPTPGGGLQLRSVLKTPQRSESDPQQSQPEPLSPAGFGASPTFSVPRRRRKSGTSDDCEDGKVVFPSLEEIDLAVSSDAEFAFDAPPLNLNMAFYEESLSQDLRESDTDPHQASQTGEPEEDADSRTPTRARNRKRAKKEEQTESEPRSRPSKRQRKQPEDSEPVKRSTRSAAKSACGKMKASASARRWNKDVDRSLYGSREYASKNPTLSPITERRSFIAQSPAVQQDPESSADTHQGYKVNPEMANGALHTADYTEANAVGNFSVRLPNFSPGRDNRTSRSAVRRGQKRRKVSVVDCEVLQEENSEQHEAESSLSLEVSLGDPSALPNSEQNEVDPDKPSAQVSNILHTEPSIAEHDATLPGPASSCPPSGEESGETEPAEEQTEEDRRSSAMLERGAANPQEEGGAANVDLAPWQADFNFEDVFKPVATRGQRSVRRSLRNQASSEHATGLAWLPRTSPESIKETRRRTRQRRLSAALTVHATLPEETQDEGGELLTPASPSCLSGLN